MMSERGRLYAVFFLAVSLIILNSGLSLAVTASVGNINQAVSGDIGDTFERNILLKNTNQQQVVVDIINTNGNIEFARTHFILSPGEEREASFDVEIVESGEHTYNFDILFSQGAQSAGLVGKITTATVPFSEGTVAYLYRKDFRIDYEVIEVFEELGLNVELINEKGLPKDFSSYRLIYVGDEKFKKDNLIPVNSYPSIIANYYHGEDFGLTDREGISKLASGKPLSVVKDGREIVVYTSSDGFSKPSIGYYFVDMENGADALQTIALTEETSSGSKFGDVIAYVSRGSRLENGKIQGGNLCFFGIVESDFWTPQARDLFEECAGFVASECVTDDECSDPEYSEPFCQDGDVYRIETSYSCEMVHMNQCVPHDNPELVEECDFGCEHGACLPGIHDVRLVDIPGSVNKIKIETSDGQTVLAGDKLSCKGSYDIVLGAENVGDLFERVDLEGEVQSNNDSIFFVSGPFEIFAGENRLLEHDDIDLGFFDVAPGIYTVYAEAILKTEEGDVINDNNPADNFASRELEVFCPVCSSDSDCDDENSGTVDTCHNPGEEDSYCTNENITCFVNSDCGVDGFVGSRTCNQAGDLGQVYVSYTCNRPGTTESFCSSLSENRTVQECSELCVNNECVDSECNEDSDCEDSNPLTYDQCLNPGTVVSECVNTEINCASDSDCGFNGFLGNEFCSVNTIQKNFQNSTCVSPGTLGSFCHVSVSPKDLTQCEFACTEGSCIRCDQNSDCNDNNSGTNDLCMNPGTEQSFCSNEFDIEEIACTKNLDCGADLPLQPLFCSIGGDVSQLVLTHQCNNVNTTLSYCSSSTETRTVQECNDLCQNGQCLSIECYNNADCSDGNYNTVDVCHNAGTAQSYCTNEQLNVECYTDGQCGTDGFLGESFCSESDVWRLYKDYECNAAGTYLSYCSLSIYPEVIEQCQSSCSDGVCQPEEEVECSYNSECGTNHFVGDSYCVGDEIYRNYQSFMCENAGSAQSYCSSEVQDQFINSCPYACTLGSCVRCDEASDCNDWNSGTSDVCVFPDTALSYCQNTVIGECNPGQTRSCGETNTGECSLGTETCDANGHWGTCYGAVYPQQEVCDDKDNDCDGSTDEGEVCTPVCNNECTFGSRQCSNGGLIACGDFDSDPCTEWSIPYACEPDETCTNGECVQNPPVCSNECTFGTRECYSGGTRTCGQFDSDSCMEWSSVSQCSSDKVCDSGYCMPKPQTCTNECTFGTRDCSNGGPRMCGQFDGDSCMEWSAAAHCSSDEVCQSGYCI